MPSLSGFRNWGNDHRGDDRHAAESVFIVGLGRFGTALAKKLVTLDIEVMAIDTDSDLVTTWADELTHTVVADATNATVLEQLGAKNFDAAVVAIGTGIESSVLATAALWDAGCKNIWAKAISDEHRHILERVGAHHVVQPENQMGERVARIVANHVVDYFELDDGFVLAEVEAPDCLVDRSLSDSEIRAKFGVTVVAIKLFDGTFTYATADTVPSEGDLLVAAGAIKDIERFSKLR